MLPHLFLESWNYHVTKPIQVILAKAILDQPASILSGSWPQMCESPQSEKKKKIELPSLGWTKLPNHSMWLNEWELFEVTEF